MHVKNLPDYEVALWGEGDATAYTRNLFNVPVLCYSGENDAQMYAARIMEECYEMEGRTLPHIVGPGMGHAFHPDTRGEVSVFLYCIYMPAIDRSDCICTCRRLIGDETAGG